MIDWLGFGGIDFGLLGLAKAKDMANRFDGRNPVLSDLALEKFGTGVGQKALSDHHSL